MTSLDYLTEQVDLMVGTWRSQAGLNVRLAEIVNELHAELAEIRDSIIDLDHGKASAAHLRELHSRVDALEPPAAPTDIALDIVKRFGE